MIRVKKQNKLLTVDDRLKDLYLKKGFSVIDEQGKIIQFASNSDKEQLVEANKLIKKLEKEIAELKSKSVK